MPLELEDPAAFPQTSFSRAWQFSDEATCRSVYNAVRLALFARGERKPSVRGLRWELTSADLVARGASQRILNQWIDIAPGDEIRVVRKQQHADLWVIEFHRCLSCCLTPGNPLPVEIHGMVGLFGLIGPLPPWDPDFEESMRASVAAGQFANTPGALVARVFDGETVAR